MGEFKQGGGPRGQEQSMKEWKRDGVRMQPNKGGQKRPSESGY